jgi:hypothetical protein
MEQQQEKKSDKISVPGEDEFLLTQILQLSTGMIFGAWKNSPGLFLKCNILGVLPLFEVKLSPSDGVLKLVVL